MAPIEARLDDCELRLMEMSRGFIAVRDGYVNLEDLMHSGRPGAIVRCRENPRDCIQIIPGPDAPVGCIAGWISEEE